MKVHSSADARAMFPQSFKNTSARALGTSASTSITICYKSTKKQLAIEKLP
jgi:hypothetical protein